MKLFITKGTTDVTLLVFVQDSSSTTGAGLTAVTDAMLTGRYIRVEDDNDVVSSTLTMANLASLTAAHSDGGWEQVDATNAPGWYRFDIPDAAVATGARSVGISLIDAGANNIAQITIEIQLIDIDVEDSVRGGMTAMPNAAADGAGGLPISDAGGLDLDAMNTNVSSILTDTAEIGAAGAGLTAVPWNAVWDAEVQSEVDDALVANHLDHLFKTDYDPASKPGTGTALLNEVVESDGGVSRFTTNALENAPGGGGGTTDVRQETSFLQGGKD